MASNADTTILVTGGSGFLGLECLAQCLAAGYQVRTTIRSDSKKAAILQALSKAKPPVDTARLSFVVADLMKDDGWAAATKDAKYVLHVASPFPAVQPKDENELIKPAVEGTLRVLRAAKASPATKRVVVTSSSVAVTYGTRYVPGKVYNEEDWSDPEGKGSPITPYAKSKTLAEKAAWDFIEREGGSDLELAVVNPVGIFGPALLLPNESTTCGIVLQMLQGKMPAVPKISFGAVDVRDVASLHLLAATRPEAKGQRYLAVAGSCVSLAEMGKMLKDNLGPKAKKAPTMSLPDSLVRLMSFVMPQLGSVTPELGRTTEMSNAKARKLGWEPKGNEEAIVSCARALIDAGVV